MTTPASRMPAARCGTAAAVAVLLASFFVPLHSVAAQPVALDPARYRVEPVPFADLSGVGGGRVKAFGLTLFEGGRGFAPGLYVTTGPHPDDRSDRLLHVDPTGRVTTVRSGLVSAYDAIFARGAYPSGVLISEPVAGRISRLDGEGNLTTFATLGVGSVGAAALAYGADGLLYSTRTVGALGEIVRIGPSGDVTPFATIPLAGNFFGIESLGGLTLNPVTGGFVATVFAFDFLNNPLPADNGSIYSVSPDGGVITKLLAGEQGIELPRFGPGGDFGGDLYVPQLTARAKATGRLDRLVQTPSGDFVLEPFLDGTDATSVVFDTGGVLGGGMLVTDFVQPRDSPGRIWRVTAVPEPSTTAFVGAGVLALLTASLRQRPKRRCDTPLTAGAAATRAPRRGSQGD